MKFNWKQDLKGLILLGLLILGLSVPTGIIVRQYNEINALERKLEDMQLDYYDDLFESQGEIFYFEMRYMLKELEFKQYKEDVEQLLYDWDDTIEVIIEYYESGSTLTLEEYFQVNYPALYSRILGYNW